MKTFRLEVTNIEYGFIDVVAETEEEARDLAYSLEGDYYVNKNDLSVGDLIQID